MLKRLYTPLPKAHKISLLSVIATLGLVTLLPSSSVEASRHEHISDLAIGTLYPLEIDFSRLPSESLELEQLEPQWQTVTVKRGDNLAKIFDRFGLTPQDVYAVTQSGKQAEKLLRMMPGDEVALQINEQGQFAGLQYAYSPLETLQIIPDEQGQFKTNIDQRDVETRIEFASGEIDSSFWHAASKAGLNDNQIMSLASIFGWDIDFALEIRRGDSFSVMYETHYIDGEFSGYGDILAAEFSNQGETFTAIRYEDGNYYTAEGRSMRKSFLRAPVNFRYISSNFNPNRFHPVQKRVKPHNGVDYAADLGTPVMSAGDGKVIKAGYDRYNGNFVFIQHGERYTTKYLHFNKRPKVRTGETVKQGQVIGYVGKTGLAAGVHLHYEFLVDGVHRNPRTVQLPKANPIAKAERAKFEQLAQDYLQQLNNSKRIMLAMN
ncbi:peptidoglycan DD-metalloendopeptidase family protein [Bowmanella sp. JS7-9]|uniref:Peptidoglycan DD-metalloendopeptidase family protein n=1 Tax=Pseudobowmanella zhangzhouensis TaxID=1537679 RepID=A0ABW1XPQ7_9ALTE|nr:peptidoglycan DD-metalloendopeptidase family protein [Bowmanella sp. JS7-9]TBX21812.1 peptidase M23 [Bowmanella sp. JS7-9]